MRQHLVLLVVSAAIVMTGPNDAQSAGGDRSFSWQRTDTSLALLNGDQMVWQHVHDRSLGKPFMRFGLLDGTELTRPWPFSDDYPKNDHVWHRALWWSWKSINGINFWEQHQEGTEPVEVKIEASDDFSAIVVMTIHYHQPDLPPVVKETRTIAVSSPDADGDYHVDWSTTFTSATGEAVEFGQNSYGGLAIRFSADCCGLEADRTPWAFLDDQDRENKTNNQQARWVAYCGQTPAGQTTTVAMFDHPENPGHPAYWQLRNQYPYLNPSLTCKESYQLTPDQQLTLKYRILVSTDHLDTHALQQQWQVFAAPTTD